MASAHGVPVCCSSVVVAFAAMLSVAALILLAGVFTSPEIIEVKGSIPLYIFFSSSTTFSCACSCIVESKDK